MNDRNRPAPGEATDLAVAPERLAALLDGRLTEQERGELLSRLADSPNDAALLSESAAVLGELEKTFAAPMKAPTGVREPVPPSAWASRKRQLIGATAAVGVVAVAAWFGIRYSGRGPAGPTDYVAMLSGPPEQIPAGWSGYAWSAVRSNLDGAMSTRARAVRLGVRLVDLQVAVNASDTAVSAIASDIARLVSDLPASEVIRLRYTEIARRSGEPQASLQAALDEGARAVRVAAGADAVDVGSWLEAARLAAARGDHAYFRQRPSGRILDALVIAPDLTTETRATVERVRSTVASQAPAWNQVADDLTAILTAAARGP
jgi:hypothetical protein